MKTAEKTGFLFMLAVGLATACQPNLTMQISITQRRNLPGIASASGIEVTEQGIFVMSDDAEYLYQLDEDWNIEQKFRVASQVLPLGSGRIPKLEKPDFEAMAALPDGSLMLFGSGSVSPQRDSVVIVQPSSGGVQRFSMANFYEEIKKAAQLPDAALNLEAAAIHDGQIYFFNRGINLMAYCPLEALLSHLKTGTVCPTPHIDWVELPKAEGSIVGFSGATTVPGCGLALFTATVEHTDNWVDDGEVGGSWIGCMTFPTGEATPYQPLAIPVTAQQGDWLIKVESVAITKNPAPGVYHLLLVTDSDGGVSEILEAVLTLPDF